MTETASSKTLLGGVYDLDAVDKNVRVQDDLFRHANGTWLRTAEIPADRASTGSFTDLRDAAEADCRTIIEECADAVASESTDLTDNARKVGLLYAAFMDEEAVNSLGSAPLNVDLADVLTATDKSALAAALGKLATIGFMGAFGAEVEVDLNDPNRYTTWLGQDGLGLPDESYYREDTQAQVRADYLAHIANMLEMADLPALLSGDAEAPTAAEVAEKIMALETAFAKGHWDRVACRDIEKMNNPMDWQALTASAPGFDWEAWRGAIDAPEAFLSEAVVTQPDYLPYATQVWAEADLFDLRAWAAWHVLHRRAAMLSEEFVNENFDFYGKKLNGTDELRPRWKRGVGLVESCLGEAVGELYTERHFPASHKAAMEQLVADLIEAYRQSITSLEWMGTETRERALDKLSKFNPKIGYPVRWRDYSGLEIVPNDLLASVRASEAFDQAYEFSKLGKPVDRDEWHMTPQTVNAYYNPTMNEIVFPAAILQPPFFNPELDDAVNYAGIGAVIGHEIGHGFDDQGSTFDGTGLVSDWWTDADREAFQARTSALIAQYDAFVPKQLAAKHAELGTPAEEIPHVNGALTIGENIGDLGGLGIGLKAYKLALARQGIDSVEDAPVIDGLSAMERFFYSWAKIWREKRRDALMEMYLTVDPHSPTEFRCNGIVRNMDAFYETFGVTESDALWLAPEERVSIW